MSTRIIAYHYQGKEYKVKVVETDTLLDLFNKVKEQCGLVNDASFYKILTPGIFDFTGETKTFDAVHPGGNFHIVTRDDFSTIEEYLDKTYPSLKLHAYRSNPKIIQLYKSLNLLHKLAISINDPRNKEEALSVIPPGFIDDCTDMEIIIKVSKYLVSMHMKNLKNLSCKKCGGTNLTKIGVSIPTKIEAEKGAIEVIKLLCNDCESTNRISSYTTFSTINKQRTGGYPDFCVELGAIYTALGFNIRLVTELNAETIWLEVYSQTKKRYIPIHPIRGDVYKANASDNAFVYAVGMYECCDVTVRYATDIDDTLEKRDAIIPELEFQQIIGMKNEQWQMAAPEDMIELILEHQNNDIENMTEPL